MARSTNIYVVTPNGCMTPIAAFTVKHELQTWADLNVVKHQVWRVKDGIRDRGEGAVNITHEVYG